MELGVKRVIGKDDVRALFDFYSKRSISVLERDKFTKWVENQQLYFFSRGETGGGQKGRKEGYILQEVFKRSPGQDRPNPPRTIGALVLKMAEYKTPEIKGFIIDDSVTDLNDVDTGLNALLRDVEDLLRKEGYDTYLVFANVANNTATTLFASPHFHVERIGGRPEAGKQEFVFQRNVSPCYTADPFNWLDKVLWYTRHFIGLDLPDLEYRRGLRIEDSEQPIVVREIICPRTEVYCDETQKIHAGFVIWNRLAEELKDLLNGKALEGVKLVFVFNRVKDDNAPANVIQICEEDIDRIIKAMWERVNAKPVGLKNKIYRIQHPSFPQDQAKGLVVDLTKRNFDKLLEKYVSSDFPSDYLLFYMSAPIGEYAAEGASLFFYVWDYDEVGAYGAIVGKGEIREVLNISLSDPKAWEDNDKSRSSFSTKEELSKHLAKQILKVKFSTLERTLTRENYFTFENIIKDLYDINIGASEWDEMLSLFRPEDVGHMYLTEHQVQIINRKLRTEEFDIPVDGNIDGMLQIFNKNALDVHGPYIFMTSLRKGMPISLIFFDIDDFRKVNTRHTHEGGDAVLKSIIKTIRERCIDKSQQLFRFGGEEFVVLLPGVGKNKGVEKAEEIRKTIEESPTSYEGTLVKCTLSLGVCCTEDSNITSWGTFLNSAQKAEKRAKELGKNRVSIF